MKKIISIVLATLLVFGLSACGGSAKNNQANSALEDSTPTSSIAIESPDNTALKEVVLFFPGSGDSKFVTEKRFVPQTNDVKALSQTIINELQKGPISKSLVNPLVKDAKITVTKFEKGIVTVDLSKEFKAKTSSGTDSEQLTVYTIVNSLTALDSVDSVVFTVDGKADTTLKGHVSLSSVFIHDPNLDSADVDFSTDEIAQMEIDSSISSPKKGKSSSTVTSDTTKQTPQPETAQQKAARINAEKGLTDAPASSAAPAKAPSTVVNE